MDKLVRENEEMYNAEMEFVEKELNARSQAEGAHIGFPPLESAEHSSMPYNMSDLKQAPSQRSSIDIHSQISLPMGFKEQVAAVKVQSALRTFLVRQRLKRQSERLLKRFKAEQESLVSPKAKQSVFRCPLCVTNARQEPLLVFFDRSSFLT